MASDVTILETMSVRLVGDGRMYRQMLQQAQTDTVQSMGSIDKSAQRPTQSFHRMGGSIRETRHAVMILATTTGMEHLAHPAMMAVYAYRILGHSIKGVITQMGIMKVLQYGLIGAGLLAGIAVAYHTYEKLGEQQKQLGEAASKTWDTIVSGAKTTSAALASINIDHLSEQFKTLAKEKMFDPSMWEKFKGVMSIGKDEQLGWNIAVRRFNESMQEAITMELAGRMAIREALKDEKIARMMNWLQQERVTEKAKEEVVSLQKKIAMIGMGEAEAKRYALVWDMMQNSHMTEKEALRALGIQLREMSQAQRELAVADVDKQIEGYKQKAQAINLGADAAERAGLVEKFAKDQGVSVIVAREMLGEKLQKIADLQDYIAGQKLFEKNRTPAEKYQKTITELNRLLQKGSIDYDTYGRSVRDAAKELDKGSNQTEKFDTALYGSVESVARWQDQITKLQGQQLPFGALGPEAAGRQETTLGKSKFSPPIDQLQSSQQKDMVDLLKQIRDKIGKTTTHIKAQSAGIGIAGINGVAPGLTRPTTDVNQ